ncbi:NADPH:quinone reductase [Streptomyces sp. WM6373]|uniref:NAD(P)-dependent alcohol dehydrogenase n=1 Tax=Streptomyces TaxID=1883 RepID=UPI0006AEF82A|nr:MULTISPECIES: NAD(P)-dependent alcohol dehydrogenase [unclassified Streptomyces]KOU33858.1 NADPH:quinone reductase [Streptomyces sp. WM6373]KOU58338.1 NADPH:quinone reductase [Streptomyces sp. IGB124]KOU87486.1 NADPH:quinone reductase [Streptomyces sp. XY58]KOU89228.1 NADPH:quinone reductase [Streptomyces sp. XY66]KOV06284.1 NADPH:quinone reductase [Streptomyces sp. XY37]
MKAIVQDRYGPVDVLRLDEVDRPAPGRGEVLVRVHAAAVDQGVWHLVTGLPYALRPVFGLRAPRVRTPGMDLAGRVEAVGPDVTRVRPGDEVYGSCQGSFAEYACAKEDALAPKPEGLGFEEAATVPVSGVTALKALRDVGRVRAGQRVLVLGASGGVGTYAVQLAKAFGAHVTGVCSAAKTDLVRSIGADEAVDYRQEDPVDGSRRYDLILDIAGNRPLSRLRHALTARGTLVIVGGEGGGRWLGGNERQLGALLLSPFVGQRLRSLAVMEQHHSDLRALTELIEDGSVTPVVDRSYPLAEVPDAIRHLRGGRVRGKIAIRL